MLGYKFIQGILSAVFAVVALGLLFFKPKIAIIPALLIIGTAAWFYTSPPIIEEIQYDPEKIIFGTMVGGLLLALAGLVAPKKS